MKQTLLELKLWRWQRYSALLVVPLLGFHVVFQYFILGFDEITYDLVSARLQLGILLGIDIVLLIIVSGHAYLGLRSILMDHADSDAASGKYTLLSAFMFTVTVLYGLVALFAFL